MAMSSIKPREDAMCCNPPEDPGTAPSSPVDPSTDDAHHEHTMEWADAERNDD